MTQRIQTPISGITTTSTYEDGECYSLVNLRPKNGALQPVSPRKVEQELSQIYDIVFIHQNNDYKNWIGVINEESSSSIFWNILNEPKDIQLNISERINAIQQIGNTLSLITSSNIYYVLFNNGNYTFLGELPELPAIKMTSSDKIHNESLFEDEYGEGTSYPDDFITHTKGLVNRAMEKLVSGDSEGETTETQEGYGPIFFDAFFIRYAFRLYDGTLTKHSPPILVMPNTYIYILKTVSYERYSGGALKNGSCVDVYGYYLNLEYDFRFTGHENWNEIIKSIDVFISSPAGISNIENMTDDLPVDYYSLSRQWYLINPNDFSPISEMKKISSFYYIKSINLGEQNTATLPDKTNTDEVTRMENLIYQEVMTDDPFSNHKYGAECSYTYNNRLHLGNIKTTFFNGYSPLFFLWGESDGDSDIRGGSYNGSRYSSTLGEKWEELVFEVEINTGLEVQKVYSRSTPTSTTDKFFMSAFISYPDSRAQRLTIYRYSSNQWYKVFDNPLEKHDFLNLSYFLNEKLFAIREKENPTPVELPDTSKAISFYEPNKLKVSELNNPLNFPNINTYQIGNGTIMALATNAMNVSDRNYGQYPLYVFTSQGIWNLNVGTGEVVYSTQSAPTYTEAPTTSVVCSTPFGVVFTSKRGLMIINGQSTDYISSQIEQEPVQLSIQLPEAETSGVVLDFTHISLKQFLATLGNMIYNSYESELIITSKTHDFNFVLNFDSNIFYQSTEIMDIQVKNTFPELYVTEGKRLKNFAESGTPSTHVTFITRPLSYGTSDKKKLDRMILRTLLYNLSETSTGKRPVAMIHASYNGINFGIIRGMGLKPTSESRDIDMGLMGSSKYNRFMFTMAGLIDDSSLINLLDCEVEKEYDNTKMR